MIQTIGIESSGEKDPAVVTWGEAFKGIALYDALSGLLDVASEKAKELMAGNVGYITLKAVPDLPEMPDLIA